MKIRKLTITNFSSHVSTLIEFGAPMALIVGTLGAGKSSILQAIEYALTGECSYYHKRTDNRVELIHERNAGSGMQVSLYTDKGNAQRTRGIDTEGWAWNDQGKQTATAMDTAVTDALGVSKTVLGAVLNVSNFFELEEKVQKELIIGLVGAEVTHDKVASLFTGEMSALALLRGKINSLTALNNAYDYTFERRTVVKRELKDLKPPAPPEGSMPPIQKIQELLRELEAELQQKIGDKARLEGAAQAGGVVQRLQSQRLEQEKIVQPGLADGLVEALATAETAKAQAAELAGAAEQKLRTINAEILSRQKNIALLVGFNGRCVAGDHACPAPAADMEKALGAQRIALGRFNKEAQTLELEWKELCQRRDDNRSISECRDRIRDHTDAVQRHARAKKEIESIDFEIAKLSNIPSNSDGIDRLAIEIAKLHERIQRGHAQLTVASSWIERERQVKTVAEQRGKLEKELSHLESLVEFFGPKGVKVQLIDERIGRFVDQINQQLQHFGFTVSIVLEPWRMLKDGRPISRLSRSERFRMGVAFQIAIAKMTGLNFLVCDDAELLTPEVRGAMMQMLAGAGLDQVIVIMTLMNAMQFLEGRKKMPPSIEAFMVTNSDGVSLVERV